MKNAGNTEHRRTWWRTGTAGVVGIALATVVVHLATGWRYGFDRDELMALEDARHLAWGYVQYPPMTAFFGWVALKLFGTSLVGFRFFAALVQAVALVLTGLMAKEIARAYEIRKWNIGIRERQNGGIKPPLQGKGQEAGEWAMVVAALAGVPFCLGAGALMQYISFDYVCWVVVAYGMVRLLSEEVALRGSSGQASGEWRWSRQKVEQGKGERVEECRNHGPDDMKTSTTDDRQIEIRNSKFEIREDKRHASKGPQRDAESSQEGVHPFEAQGKQRWIPAKNAGGMRCGRWWIVIGAGIGLGMMAKYTMGLLVAGVVVGVLVTQARRYLRSGWLWAGAAVSWLIFLPNFLWQWKRAFISLDFLRFLHERDVQTGVTDGFFAGQLELMMLAAPLALAGLWFLFVERKTATGLEDDRRWSADDRGRPASTNQPERRNSASEGQPYKAYQLLGWMYVVPLVLLVALKGRDYYLAPAYPMLYAAGAVWLERKWPVASGEWQEESAASLQPTANSFREEASHPQKTRVGHPQAAAVEILRPPAARAQDAKANWQPIVRCAIVVALLVDIAVAAAVALPIAPVNSRWWKMAAKVDLVFPEEIGWEEFTESVAQVWRRIAEEERAHTGILAGNYGEVGALNLYGEKWGLPRAISGVNSSWERGYGDPAPLTLVVVGYPREFLQRHFLSCEVGGRVWNKYEVANEETIEDPEIFVCRDLQGSWKQFWMAAKKYA